MGWLVDAEPSAHELISRPENYRKSGQVSMGKMFAAFSGKDNLL
jgi:hypothetical protein